MRKSKLNLVSVSIIIGLVFCLQGILSSQENPEKLEISPQVIQKHIPPYNLTLKQLIREAEKNIKKIDGQIQGQEKLTELREHFIKGELLYQEGKLKEAKKEFAAILSLTKDARTRANILRAEKKMRPALPEKPVVKKPVAKKPAAPKKPVVEKKPPKVKAIPKPKVSKPKVSQPKMPKRKKVEVETVKPLSELGISFYQQGRFEEALTEFKKVLMLDPPNQTAKKYINLIFQQKTSK